MRLANEFLQVKRLRLRWFIAEDIFCVDDTFDIIEVLPIDRIP